MSLLLALTKLTRINLPCLKETTGTQLAVKDALLLGLTVRFISTWLVRHSCQPADRRTDRATHELTDCISVRTASINTPVTCYSTVPYQKYKLYGTGKCRCAVCGRAGYEIRVSIMVKVGVKIRVGIRIFAFYRSNILQIIVSVIDDDLP